MKAAEEDRSFLLEARKASRVERQKKEFSEAVQAMPNLSRQEIDDLVNRVKVSTTRPVNPYIQR